MILVASCLGLFLVIFLLVSVFHLYSWSSDWFSLPGLRSWVSSFECGFVSERLVENYFSYTYFVLLVFFVVFDLEVSLLLNMPLQGVLFKNLGYYLFFLFLLSVGFSIEIKKGYVEWGY
uniref:NADH-ubiquinone oxidoreductase chain 3 n=1 Tax=Cercaria capricornia TaxID=1542953 RepID=A0A2I6K2A9_9TREM|nr:NADH dehydrogenase subunit 3 [Cercaria capricornia]AUL93144.1 NADH dehydrogenase subunit 3 [Cercaria capricornia]AUL93145.1 NADH dehydrogenase subunit 3 [Cercaria capricornia]